MVTYFYRDNVCVFLCSTFGAMHRHGGRHELVIVEYTCFNATRDLLELENMLDRGRIISIYKKYTIYNWFFKPMLRLCQAPR